MKLSERAQLVIEFMLPGRKYTADDIARGLQLKARTAGMQLTRMAERAHLDQHRERNRYSYSLPGTVTVVPPAPPSAGRACMASNLGQIIGRLMSER